MKKILFLAFALVALASCSKSESVESVSDDMLQITSGIATRAVDQTWDSGDTIGVYMTETGSTEDYIGEPNTPYSTTSDGISANFSVVSPSAPLYYPQSGNIDLMAYYPYVEGVDVDEVDYAITASEFDIESNNIYTYTISVSKTAVKITGSTINPWGSDTDNGSLDATDLLADANDAIDEVNEAGENNEGN